ncbi:hypothetical protein ABVT39_008036 [Epinephelus coioides]
MNFSTLQLCPRPRGREAESRRASSLLLPSCDLFKVCRLKYVLTRPRRRVTSCLAVSPAAMLDLPRHEERRPDEDTDRCALFLREEAERLQPSVC